MRWKQIKNMSAKEVKTFIDDHRVDTFTILDVSQPPEYEIGHIPGAKLIPLQTLPNRIGELSIVKPIIIY